MAISYLYPEKPFRTKWNGIMARPPETVFPVVATD
jgi:hypothetical protein